METGVDVLYLHGVLVLTGYIHRSFICNDSAQCRGSAFFTELQLFSSAPARLRQNGQLYIGMLDVLTGARWGAAE